MQPQVAHQEEVVSILRKALTTGNLPHLLFYGPPGTGKTTTALAIARQLYGCAPPCILQMYANVCKCMQLYAFVQIYAHGGLFICIVIAVVRPAWHRKTMTALAIAQQLFAYARFYAPCFQTSCY